MKKDIKCNDLHQYDAEQDYKLNIENFRDDNLPTILKADRLRRIFNQTMKYNMHKRYFYREIADIKFLILTANETERETLFSCFVNYPKEFNVVKKNIIKRIPYNGLVYSIFYVNDIKVVHVEPEMTDSHSKGGTAETLKEALKRVRPTFVISLGVAFGYDMNKQQLCDVLVGRQFFSYDKSTKIKNDEINIKKLHIVESSTELLNKIKSTVTFEDKISGMFDYKFQTHIGNFLTGEYTIDSFMFRNLIGEPFKPFGIIGGEMEAFGMFSVIDEYNKKIYHRNAQGIMIKGVCDWAVGKNINIDDINLNVEDKDQTPNCDNTNDNQHKLSNEDFKNALQTLAMCNTCTVFKSFLKANNLFSDYRIHGIRKWFGRIPNGVVKFFCELRNMFTEQ